MKASAKFEVDTHLFPLERQPTHIHIFLNNHACRYTRAHTHHPTSSLYINRVTLWCQNYCSIYELKYISDCKGLYTDTANGEAVLTYEDKKHCTVTFNHTLLSNHLTEIKFTRFNVEDDYILESLKIMTGENEGKRLLPWNKTIKKEIWCSNQPLQ